MWNYLLIIWSELDWFICKLGIKVIQTKFSRNVWFKGRHHLLLLHLKDSPEESSGRTQKHRASALYFVLPRLTRHTAIPVQQPWPHLINLNVGMGLNITNCPCTLIYCSISKTSCLSPFLRQGFSMQLWNLS